MTAALYYHPEAYTTGGPKLMGRNAAGESFLRGYLAHSAAEELWVQVQQQQHAQHFAQTARAQGCRQPVHAVVQATLGSLAKPGLVYFPGPGIGEHAWHRSVFGHGAWSLCGITHTLSSAGAMDAIAQLLVAPIQPWDALICTSSAARAVVGQVLDSFGEHLTQRLGATQFVLPKLPVIPIGIHTEDFRVDVSVRANARHALAVDDNTHVVSFMGRLSFHAKAHPLAMYQALEIAARALPAGQRIVLLECGRHANAAIARAFSDAAAEACPSVRVVWLDGRDSELRNFRAAWAAADIFCSLSDNIQETFGITPIEAMAAGLPVVVSDWDGYRDTVRDGVDGFRIATVMPQAGLGHDLAARHALEIDTYDMYCGHACSLVSVDVPAAARAFTTLLQSPALRRQMGESGRARAREHYDWAAIIPRYEALWAQLRELRLAHAPGLKPLPHPWPARMDPFHAFAAYPSHRLQPHTLLALQDSDAATALARLRSLRQLAMVDFAKAVLPTDDEMQRVLQAAAPEPRPASQWVEGIEPQRQALVFRSLAWLLKLGLLRLA